MKSAARHLAAAVKTGFSHSLKESCCLAAKIAAPPGVCDRPIADKLERLAACVL